MRLFDGLLRDKRMGNDVMKITLVKYVLAALISLVVIWSCGFLFVNYKHYIEQPFMIWFYGVLNSILAIGFFVLLLSPIYFFAKNKRVSYFIIHFLFGAILLLELISLFYFSVTLELLDRTVFQFDSTQLSLIFQNYFVFKWYYLLIPFPLVLYFFIGRRLLPQNERKVFYGFFIVGICAIFLDFQIGKHLNSYAILSKNKTIFFFQSIINKSTYKYITLTDADISFYQKFLNHGLNDKEFLFYRPIDQKNTLLPFFALKATPPNFVFIIVEGLSASFSGSNADELSYTPFLDSLSLNSLRFENTLSTSDRSFAALPSILGSLPHGESGFTNQKLGFPNTVTLPTWLFENGYIGSFYFGGYARFDNMDLFMKSQGFEYIFDHSEYNYEKTGLKTSIDSIPFGVSDKVYLNGVIDSYKARKLKDPFLDVYFTLSMHYPYMIEEHQSYYDRVRLMIDTTNVSSQIKAKHRKYIQEFATFLYTDDALRNYFEARKNMTDHENTIYMIIGDHYFGEIPHTSPIEKYRPIMTIYSPLLKRTKEIKGTNSHLDILPSLYNLLQQKYDFQALEKASWLGRPFDTSAVFHCDRNILFMVNDRSVEDILFKNYFLSKDYLFTVEDRLQLKPNDDADLKGFMKRLRLVSRAMHKEVVVRNKLVPDSQ